MNLIEALKTGYKTVRHPFESFKSLFASTRAAVTTTATRVGERTQEAALESAVTIKGGAATDKKAAGALRRMINAIGATVVDVAEGKRWAQKRYDWAKKKEALAGNRAQGLLETQSDRGSLHHYPQEEASDAEQVAVEEEVHRKFHGAVQSEKNFSFQENTEADGKIIERLVSFINRRRRSNGKNNLRINKPLTKVVTQRIQYKAEKPDQGLSPLHVSRVDPVTRKLETKETTAIMVKEKPVFSFSDDERRRIKSINKKEGDATGSKYSYEIWEKEEDYIRNVKETRVKRNALKDDREYPLELDFNTGNYPMDGNFHVLLDELLKAPAWENELLKGDYEEIAVGIHRRESKVFLNVALLKNADPDPAANTIDVPDLEVYLNNDWWFEQIPAGLRSPAQAGHPASELYKLYYDRDRDADPPGPNRFESGVSVYHYYRFLSQVAKLKAEGMAVDIKSVEIHPQEPIFTQDLDTLHITVSVNGEEQVLKLIKGTHLVDLPKKEEGFGTTRSVGKYCPLEDYLTKINIPQKAKTSLPVRVRVGPAPVVPPPAPPAPPGVLGIPGGP